MKSIEEIQEELEKVLKKKRYAHTLGVRFTAQALAMRFQEDIVAAGYAGVLHDCAKYLANDEMLKECKKNQIICSDTELENPHLLHAKLGAVYAQKKYGIDDSKILSAIRWHTTGKPAMSDFEKIIFIADYIEPGRKPLPNMDLIRRISFEDLDLAMKMILENTISYLEENNVKKKPIDKNSIEAYEYYKK